MEIKPIIVKILFKYLFNEDEKKKILECRSNRSIEAARMIAMGLPQFKCDIIDFTDDDFETLAFFRYPLTPLSEMIDNTNGFNEAISILSKWYFFDRNNIPFDKFIIEGGLGVYKKSLYHFKNAILNSERSRTYFANYLPVVLAIKMGTISVKSWSGINKDHEGFYSFLVINRSFMSLFATRNKYSLKEAKRGYVHPHVSPLYVGGHKIDGIYPGEKKISIGNDDSKYMNIEVIRPVCLGDSDLGNYLSDYSIGSENSFEIECIMISEELSRIFNTENDNSTNFPYIRMSEMGDTGDNTNMKMVHLSESTTRLNNYFACVEIAKMIYTNKLLHFTFNDKGYKCNDSTYYIMDIVTKCYTALRRDYSALTESEVDGDVSVYNYVTDGVNVYVDNQSQSTDMNVIELINFYNGCTMFSYKDEKVTYNVDIVEVSKDSNSKTLVDSTFCSNVLLNVYGLYYNTGHYMSGLLLG